MRKPTISLLLIGSFVCCLAFRQSAEPPSTSPALTRFTDFAFEIPAGWKAVTPDRKTTAAMLLLGGERWQDARGMLKVDAGKPVQPTARETAEYMAGNDGKVLDDPVEVDGEKAIRVDIPSNDLLRPRHVLVVFREGKVYLLMAAGAGDTDVLGAFERVARTWRRNAPTAR